MTFLSHLLFPSRLPRDFRLIGEQHQLNKALASTRAVKKEKR